MIIKKRKDNVLLLEVPSTSHMQRASRVYASTDVASWYLADHRLEYAVSRVDGQVVVKHELVQSDSLLPIGEIMPYDGEVLTSSVGTPRIPHLAGLKMYYNNLATNLGKQFSIDLPRLPKDDSKVKEVTEAKQALLNLVQDLFVLQNVPCDDSERDLNIEYAGVLIQLYGMYLKVYRTDKEKK